MKTSTYAQAGVNLEAGDDASKIMFEASRRTWPIRKGLPGEIKMPVDSFSAVRFVDVARFPDAVVGMNFDGVGTKIEIAERVGDHTTIAFDLFAMVCDDAARTGGEPMLLGSILDCRTVSAQVVRQLAEGVIKAAQVAQVAVINGEVAELGNRVAGFNDTAYNWGAGVTWIARSDRIISGGSVTPNQAIVTIREKGLRSNGLSLIRKAFFEHCGPDWHNHEFDGTTLGRAVLEPSRIYTPLIVALTGGYSRSPLAKINAVAHVTGGGVPGKLGRSLLAAGCGAMLTHLFEPCPVMLHCQNLARIGDKEAYRAWNMGNGLLIITPDPEIVIEEALRQGYEARVAGQTRSDQTIQIKNKGLRSDTEEWLTFPL